MTAARVAPRLGGSTKRGTKAWRSNHHRGPVPPGAACNAALRRLRRCGFSRVSAVGEIVQPLQRFPGGLKPLKRLCFRCFRCTRLKPGANEISKLLAEELSRNHAVGGAPRSTRLTVGPAHRSHSAADFWFPLFRSDQPWAKPAETS